MNGFGIETISDTIYNRMAGKSFQPNEHIDISDLRVANVLYVDFDGRNKHGQLIIHKIIASETLDIFQELFVGRFLIDKIRLIDDYDADDALSMADNNSSAFCYRPVTFGAKLSSHALGLAIDINPLQNPYVKTKADNNTIILPPKAAAYVDRGVVKPGMIIEGDCCVQAFIKRGWAWGGHFQSLKDYQHFEKRVEEVLL